MTQHQQDMNEIVSRAKRVITISPISILQLVTRGKVSRIVHLIGLHCG